MTTDIIIDLSTSAGNAYALSALARKWAKQLDRPDLGKSLLDGAASYEAVLDRFDGRFKDLVDYRFLHDPRKEVLL